MLIQTCQIGDTDARLSHMFPCARRYAGRKLNSLPAASLESRTSEPLLFLYPEWFRRSCQIGDGARKSQKRTVTNTPAHCKEDTSAGTHTPGPSILEEDNTTSAPIASSLSRTPVFKTTSPQDVVRPTPYRPDHPRRIWKRVRSIAGDLGKHVSPDKSSFDPSDIDRIAMAKRLTKLVSHRPSSHDHTLCLPVDFLRWLTGTPNGNMWLHHDGSGCEITVTHAESSESTTRKVSLYGSRRAQEIAAQHLQDLQSDFEISRLERQEELETQAPAEVQDPIMKVDLLPRPKTWTLRTFHDYVEDVVNFKGTRSIERILYPGDETYELAATEILTDLFSDEALRPCFSLGALRQAMQFLSTRTQLATGARIVWGEATHPGGIVPDIALFNSEIGRCLVVNNPSRAGYLIGQMSIFKVEPNAETWAVLLTGASTSIERRQIVEHLMDQKSYQHSSAKHSVVRALVKREFVASLSLENGVRRFGQNMRGLFGNNWLSSAVVSDMITACGKYHQSHPAPYGKNTIHDVLTLSKAYDVRIDDNAFLALLDGVRKTGTFEDTIQLLGNEQGRSNTLFDQQKVEIIFKTAWKSRLPNTCRLLWSYAASNGKITFDMQRLVDKGLTKRSSWRRPRPLTNGTLAAITIGVNIRITDFAEWFPNLNKQGTFPDVREWFFKSFKDEPKIHERMQLIHLLMEQDLTAWKTVKPMEYTRLLNLLTQAYNIDTTWLQDGTLVSKPASALLAKSMKLQLENKHLEDHHLDLRTDSISQCPQKAHSELHSRPEPFRETAVRQESYTSVESGHQAHEISEHCDKHERAQSIFAQGTMSACMAPTMVSPLALLFDYLISSWNVRS